MCIPLVYCNHWLGCRRRLQIDLLPTVTDQGRGPQTRMDKWIPSPRVGRRNLAQMIKLTSTPTATVKDLKTYAVLHRSYSENSIHFFHMTQMSAGTIHSGKSLDSSSGAWGQPVQHSQCTFCWDLVLCFFLEAYIAIVDINRLGTVDWNDARVM